MSGWVCYTHRERAEVEEHDTEALGDTGVVCLPCGDAVKEGVP
jgi:hypothetical protein